MADLRMPEVNQVIIVGRLTADPEMKYISSGMPVCQVNIALDKRWKDKATGEVKKKTAFIGVKCWTGTAEFIANTCKKGDPVMVFGELEQETWEDNNTGKQQSKTLVRAVRVQPLSWQNDQQKPAKSKPEPQDTDSEDFSDDIPF